ncbi:uncharacterized protein LOC117167822 [Belonocnema kinseyi]|uniref:uncharacterized protein LOC117167822 n=1 Tax=Belonocnema kinseyi TaxID=2817044 RepID=UPI00143DE7FB|nr:uncharacterized protein LOC117167822 [Belonocnema kinseyi]
MIALFFLAILLFADVSFSEPDKTDVTGSTHRSRNLNTVLNSRQKKVNNILRGIKFRRIPKLQNLQSYMDDNLPSHENVPNFSWSYSDGRNNININQSGGNFRRSNSLLDFDNNQEKLNLKRQNPTTILNFPNYQVWWIPISIPYVPNLTLKCY